MISLNITTDTTHPRVAVVGSLHGNELLGRSVFEAITARYEEFKNIIVIIANTDAHKADTRYIDQDLNRSFPGNPEGNTEERLAAELLALVADAEYVVDIHTTTSPHFQAAAIVGPLVDRNQRILQAFEIPEVAIMSPAFLPASLIGNVRDGVSIEYGVGIASDAKLVDQIVTGILALQHQTKLAPIATNVYEVSGTIPLETKTDAPLENFVFSDELAGYPFIVDEKNYTTMRGFLLGEKHTRNLDF